MGLELYDLHCSAVSHMFYYNDHFMRFTVFISLFGKLAYSPHGILDLDFQYDLIESLTKDPLALQDTRAATSVICIIASELLYSTHGTHVTRCLACMLCAVLTLVSSLRDLTEEEMRVICSLAMHRLERSVDHLFVFLISDLNHLSSHTQTSNIFCRPWEVKIVGHCSMAHPWFEDFVRGPCGIPSLVLALDILLKMDVDSFQEDYSTAISDILDALESLARRWIAEIATKDVVAHIVTVLM